MAKLTGPLFSVDARGSVGRELTYASRKSGRHVRFQKKQTDYENANRAPIRAAFANGIILWNSMPLDEKDFWTQIERKGYADV